jgi:stage V sporulation protein D (sporulation-specific penicillin-binding protein)
LALTAANAQNRVTGIAMNVKTGDILAIATAPTFNLNDPYTLDTVSQEKLNAAAHPEGSKEYKALRSDLLYKMWNNKAVSEIYEPGSTFKIVTVAAALETKAVAPATAFYCPGYYMVGGCRISCHKHGGHGSLTLSEGLMHSCNPVMMQSAERMGATNFYKYYQAFGYTQKTGIDLPGEGMGLFHSPASLGSTELATASFGQRFKVSILQQLCAVSTVANDGVPVTPHLLSSLQNEKDETVFTYKQKARKSVISKETAETVAAILEAGVSGNGGAKNAYAEGYHVAAKTGTSEKFEILDANGNSYLRIGSCVAFAPYDDAEIAVIIVVDEPTCANKYGSMTAAPYISKYLSAVLPYLGIQKEKAEEDVKVGNYVGTEIKKARAAVSLAGLGVEVIGEGERVLAQVPSEGTVLEKEHGKIILYTEKAVKYATVPSGKGKRLDEALTLFTNAGFNVRILGASGGDVHTEASVVSQSVPAGTKAERGTCIILEIYHKNDTD